MVVGVVAMGLVLRQSSCSGIDGAGMAGVQAGLVE
jgi:hypothetical protein